MRGGKKIWAAPVRSKRKDEKDNDIHHAGEVGIQPKNDTLIRQILF